MNENLTYYVSIKAVVLNAEGKILLAKDDQGIWDIPGGRIERGEKVQECLIREIKEELGVECELLDERPLFIWAGVSNDGWPKFSVGFSVRLSSMDLKISNENLEHRFFGKAEIPSLNIYPEFKKLSELLKA